MQYNAYQVDVMSTIDSYVLKSSKTSSSIYLHKIFDNSFVLIDESLVGLDQKKWAMYPFSVLSMLFGSV